jgi:hypothetical protein
MKEKYLIDFDKPYIFKCRFRDDMALENIPEFPKYITNRLNYHKITHRAKGYTSEDSIIRKYIPYAKYDRPTVGYVKFLFFDKRIFNVHGIGVSCINKIIKALNIMNISEVDNTISPYAKLRYQISTKLDEIIHELDRRDGEDYVNYAVSKLENLVNYIVDVREDELHGYKLRNRKEFCEYYGTTRGNLEDMIREFKVRTYKQGKTEYIVDTDECIYRLNYNNRGI